MAKKPSKPRAKPRAKPTKTKRRITHRATKATDPRKKAFAQSLITLGSVGEAAAAVGINRTTGYRWIWADPKLQAHIEDAKKEWSTVVKGDVLRMATFEEYIEEETLIEDNGQGGKMKRRIKRTPKIRQPAGWAVEIFLRNNDNSYVAQNDVSATRDDVIKKMAEAITSIASTPDMPAPDVVDAMERENEKAQEDG